jgi:hypothetical protein
MERSTKVTTSYSSRAYVAGEAQPRPNLAAALDPGSWIRCEKSWHHPVVPFEIRLSTKLPPDSRMPFLCFEVLDEEERVAVAASLAQAIRSAVARWCAGYLALEV